MRLALLGLAGSLLLASSLSCGDEESTDPSQNASLDGGGTGDGSITEDGSTSSLDGAGLSDGATTLDGGAVDAGTLPDGAPVPPPPRSLCTPPVALANTSVPTTKVGTGTPASCTDAALHAAVAAGGVVTFDCGPLPHEIVVQTPLAPPTNKDTIIDGAGKITLSGDGKVRILQLIHSFEKASPTVTVQRLTFTKGRSTDVPNTTATTKGGAALYTLGGNLTVIDSVFTDNHGPDTGQDVAGGAIYNVGAGATVIVGSRFAGNTCSNGGAIGALGSALSIVNTTIAGNQTTGSGGNPGNGGNGGGAVMDGQGKTLTICGAVFTDNVGAAFGGALFRTSYENEATTIDKSVFDGNRVLDNPNSQAGAVYLQGTKITMTASSIVNGQARFAAAMSVYEHGGPAPGQIDMTNVTIANNATYTRTDFTTRGLVGGITVGDRVLGTWTNVTIAHNAAQFASGIGGVSNRLTIRNSVIRNDAQNLYTPLNCNGTPPANGDHVVQFPASNSAGAEAPCVSGAQLVDPKLGPLVGLPGEQKVRRPVAGSPLLGLGTTCPATDQLGKARPATGCTAGAVEGI